jgi:4-amino-4-deoxy-L-arabinose transferase-like glycosyltransferase
MAGKAGTLLRSPIAWLAAAVALTPPLAFYAAREMAGAGYLQAVAGNELGLRFAHRIDGEPQAWFYYLAQLIFPWPSQPVWPWPMTASAYPWSLAFIPAAWLGLASKRTGARRAALLCTIVVVIFLVIITAAQTKLSWYAAPIFPMLAVVIALGVQKLVEASRLPHIRAGAMAIATILVLGGAFRNHQVIELAPSLPETELQAWIKTSAGAPGPVKIIDDGAGALQGHPYTGRSDFYAAVARPRDVAVVQSDYQARPGETLVWCADLLKRRIKVSGKVLASQGDCRAVRAD